MTKIEKNLGFKTKAKKMSKTKSKKKEWEAYCETAFNSLVANAKNWGKEGHYRPITRQFYMSVFDCAGVNHTGLISESALHDKSQRTNDHCLSPQFIGRMVMDNQEKFLTDYEAFKNLFWLACSTITVTKKENKLLSQLTENNGYTYKVHVPTNLKYNHLGIKLLSKVGLKWDQSIPLKSNIINVPEELLEYETQFLTL